MRSPTGFSFSLGNDKMNAVPSFSVMPHMTCCKDAPCMQKGCYAWRISQLHPRVRLAWSDNTRMLRDEGRWIEFMEDTIAFIRFQRATKFRFNVAGDIFDVKYGIAMCEIAKACPNTKFWTYTKRWDMLRQVCDETDIPENMTFILSCWNEFQPPADLKAKFPCAHYDDGLHADLIPKARNVVCGGDCENCPVCVSLKAGMSVTFHRH